MRVTHVLIALNVAFFGMQLAMPIFTSLFAFVPALFMNGFVWQAISYMFLHGDPMHIFINMLVLWMFGVPVEAQLGKRNFILLYFISGLGSVFLHLALSWGSMVPLLGASGAILGVVAAFSMFFPDVMIFFFFVPMRAKYAVFALIVIELLFGSLSLQPGIANFGHLGGILTGLAFMYFLKNRRNRRKKGIRLINDFEWFWE